jgi:hypothetical protein
MFFLNTTGTSRLSVGYMPMHALLAADGIERIGGLVRRPRVVQAVCVAAIVGRFVWWMLPALRVVRTTDSPPVAAMRWVQQNIPPGSPLVVQGGLRTFAEYYLGQYHVEFAETGHGWYVGNGPTTAPDAVTFVRPRDPLWRVFTGRYFEAYVRRIP